MPLPRALARFNRRYTNRFIEPIVRRSSGFATVHHAGRRSGREFHTPVNVFDLDGDLIVALTYGEDRDIPVSSVTARRGGAEDEELEAAEAALEREEEAAEGEEQEGDAGSEGGDDSEES